jgi:two-component system response regulator GlrR
MHDNPFMRAKSDQTKGKILLVDDDPGLLRLLSIRLRAEEFDVVAVESAHDALGSLNRFSPDLVITDLRMDKMDGIGLLKELQTRSPGLRVIIITAHGTIPDAVTATTRMNCCHWSSGRSRYRARLMSRKTGPRRSLRAMLQ